MNLSEINHEVLTWMIIDIKSVILFTTQFTSLFELDMTMYYIENAKKCDICK